MSCKKCTYKGYVENSNQYAPASNYRTISYITHHPLEPLNVYQRNRIPLLNLRKYLFNRNRDNISKYDYTINKGGRNRYVQENRRRHN